MKPVTGGQLLHRHDDYPAALAAWGEPVEPYAGYVDAFRHACRRTVASPSGWNASSPG